MGFVKEIPIYDIWKNEGSTYKFCGLEKGEEFLLCTNTNNIYKPYIQTSMFNPNTRLLFIVTI